MTSFFDELSLRKCQEGKEVSNRIKEFVIKTIIIMLILFVLAQIFASLLELAFKNIPGEAYQEYEVKAGDTLSSLAKQWGTTVSEIKKVNNLETEVIFSGTKLKIPHSTSPTPTVATVEVVSNLIKTSG